MVQKIILLIFILFLPTLLNSDEIKDNVSLIFPILNIGVGARACAMAEAFTAISDDATAIYWNSAGLSQINSTQFVFLFNKWFMDAFFSHIIAATKIGPGNIGLDIFYMNYGTFDKIESPIDDTIGNIKPFAFSSILGYGIGLTDNFSIGLSLKFIRQSLENKSYNGYFADIGTIYKINNFSLGLSLKNLGLVENYSAPINISSGLAFKILDSEFHTFIVSSDFTYIINSTQEIKFGIEYGYEKILFLRTGYKYNLTNDYLKELKEFSIGAGLALGTLNINYSFNPYGELGNSHNISLGLDFGEKATPTSQKSVEQIKTATPTQQKPKKTKEELYDLLATGGTYENAGKLDLAEQKYREILSYDETYADAWKRLGAVLYKKKKVKEAIECFEIYLKLRPDDKPVRKWLEKHK